VTDIDVFRRMQGDALDLLALGPSECSYRTLGSGAHWRLRGYAAARPGPSLLIVAAPIKQPYIWDLAPWISAIRRCLESGFRVFLLEWLPPQPKAPSAGLAVYAGQAIAEAAAMCVRESGGAKPFLIGHSLGGTFAAIFAAMRPSAIRGLLLLSSPLCFAQGSSRFRDALVAIAPSTIAMDVIPGSFLSQLSAIASPDTFIWSRLADAWLSSGDPKALELHARVERWSLDEVALSGQLLHETLQWLYREDRFCQGTLQINGEAARPSSLRVRMLAVVNTADDIAPRSSVLPALEQMPIGTFELLEHPGEIGVAFQHLTPLIGRLSHALIWPKIFAWLVAQP